MALAFAAALVPGVVGLNLHENAMRLEQVVVTEPTPPAPVTKHGRGTASADEVTAGILICGSVGLTVSFFYFVNSNRVESRSWVWNIINTGL